MFFPSLSAVSVWDISGTISPMPITGVVMFDWFFSVVLLFGLIAFAIGAIINVLTRS
jgi:hypothetical protein